jgi:hypothetical protein
LTGHVLPSWTCARFERQIPFGIVGRVDDLNRKDDLGRDCFGRLLVFLNQAATRKWPTEYDVHQHLDPAEIKARLYVARSDAQNRFATHSPKADMHLAA